MRIYLIGFMGSGKTYWGRQLGQKLELPKFDLDEQIEQAEGRPVTEIFAQEGEEYFRQKEQETLMLLSETHESFVMSTGGGTPCFFNNIDYMNKMGTTIWINSSIDSLHQRISSEQAQRPLVKNLNSEQLRAYIIKKLGDRKIFYQQASEVIFEHELSLDTFLDKIFHEENRL